MYLVLTLMVAEVLRGAETCSGPSLPLKNQVLGDLSSFSPVSPARPQPSHGLLNLPRRWFVSHCSGHCIRFQCILYSVKIYIIVDYFFFCILLYLL